MLSERPLDSLRFLRNILIHTVIQQQDHKTRRSSPAHSEHKSKKRKRTKSTKSSKSSRNSHTDNPPRDPCILPTASHQLPVDSFPPLRSSKTLPGLHAEPVINSCNTSSSETSSPGPLDEYDADKVLEKRTYVGRPRSNSDSILFYDRKSTEYLNGFGYPDDIEPDDKLSHTLKTVPFGGGGSADVNICLNTLSLPISDSATKQPTTPEKVNQTISSLMEEMNMEENVKAIFNLNGETKKDGDMTVSPMSLKSNPSNPCSTTLRHSESEVLHKNGKLTAMGPAIYRVKSLSGGIANKLQDKFKSISTTARNIPSKLKMIKIEDLSALNALRQSDRLHENDDELDDERKEDEMQCTENVQCIDVNQHSPDLQSIIRNDEEEQVDADDDASNTDPDTEPDTDSASTVTPVTPSTPSNDPTKPPILPQASQSHPQLNPMRRSKTVGSSLSFLPNFNHIPYRRQRPCFGFDIGGSLTKISFFEPSHSSGWNRFDRAKARFATSSVNYDGHGTRDISLSFPWRNGTFHFMHFQSARMLNAVDLFNSEQLLQRNESFYATGGGAHKYAKVLTERLNVKVQTGDELKCLISGLNFLLQNVRDECYYLSDPASKKPSPKRSWDLKKEGSVFPYLLVNCGSGVSILKVDSPTQYERVSGSQVGGGTYWGLCRLCSHAVSQSMDEDTGTTPDKLTFATAFELATKGDATKVNMLVSDIYGGDYPQCNLPGDLVASAFGKCVSMKDMGSRLTMGDIARGLLDVIAMNVAQLAYMNAMRFKITRVIFAGNFLRQNDLSMAMISYAIHYWSQGVMRALFLKHEGYFGSVGVMLLPDEQLKESRRQMKESAVSTDKTEGRDGNDGAESEQQDSKVVDGDSVIAEIPITPMENANDKKDIEELKPIREHE